MTADPVLSVLSRLDQLGRLDRHDRLASRDLGDPAVGAPARRTVAAEASGVKRAQRGVST